MNDWISVTGHPEHPQSLLEALRTAGEPPESPCGGKGVCGKCRVWAKGALTPPGETERALLGAALAEGVRLACLTGAVGLAWVRLCDTPAALRAETAGTLPPFAADAGTGYGFAADIGTTTLAVSLYRLSDHQLLGRAGGRNPQAEFGADVISRIEQAMEGHALELTQAVRRELSALLGTLCAGAGIAPAQLTVGTAAGNTAMLHLLIGHRVDALAAAPFQAERLFGEWIPAQDCGVSGSPGMRVYLAPCVSAYVGGDLTAAILAARLTESTAPQLLVDIGTNGEMALVCGGRMYVCATAAGPAFEGAGISCGMPAAAGAVDHFWCEEDAVKYSTVQHKPAAGLCGSGLIDAVACLLQTRLLDETGAVDEAYASAAGLLTERDGEAAVCLWASGLVLTQRDIRALQLAKGAIRAGMETLLHEANISAAQIETLLIAGGFGSYIDPASAERIGLLPVGFASKARAIGNAALSGAELMLLSLAERIRAERERDIAILVDLAGNACFAKQYMEQMMFPL